MIDKTKFKDELKAVFKKNQLESLLDERKCELFFALTERMLEENEKYNLTAIKEPSKIILNHYADCAVLAQRLEKGVKMLDVGCGAGFPSLPVAILREDVKITALDSTAKKVAYVNATAELLGLTNITAVSMRAEEAALGAMRESFDTVTARAVAAMRILSELCLPFVKIGGSFIAMKGKNADAELDEARGVIARLGGSSPTVEAISLSSEDESLSHPIIYVKKKTATPREFPRQYAKILKNPL